jgi:cytochrome subunit of sulfide dehydrogenase
MRHVPLAFIAAAAAMLAGSAAAQQRTAPISDTELAVQGCNVCHGNASYVSPTMPPIRGADPSVLYTALIELKTDKRQATIMNRIAKGYSDEQLRAIAEYLSKN